MKKFKKIIVPVLLCTLLFVTAIFAAGDSFDSSTDPVVALSYINEVVIPDLEAQIKEVMTVAEANSNKASKSELKAVADIVSSLEKQLSNVNAAVASIMASLEDENNKRALGPFDVVKMTYGQKIFSEKDSFEITLRTGSAQVISPFSYGNGTDVEYEQGILDIQKGADLLDGENVEKNHMLLVPKGGDGRGLMVTSEYAYFLVRGEYYIV